MADIKLNKRNVVFFLNVNVERSAVHRRFDCAVGVGSFSLHFMKLPSSTPFSARTRRNSIRSAALSFTSNFRASSMSGGVHAARLTIYKNGGLHAFDVTQRVPCCRHMS